MGTETLTIDRCTTCGVPIGHDRDYGLQPLKDCGAERWCDEVPGYETIDAVPLSELEAERKLREDEERHADEMAGLLDEASPIVAAQPGEWARAVGRAFDAAFARHRRRRSSGEDGA